MLEFHNSMNRLDISLSLSLYLIKHHRYVYKTNGYIKNMGILEYQK